MNKERYFSNSQEKSYLAPYLAKYSGRLTYLAPYLTNEQFLPSTRDFPRFFNPHAGQPSYLPPPPGRPEPAREQTNRRTRDEPKFNLDDMLGDIMEASNARNHPDKSRQELEAELARKQEALLQTNLVADVAYDDYLEDDDSAFPFAPAPEGPEGDEVYPFAKVTKVLPGSPAFQAQLRIGDLIIKAHSIDIFSYDDATTALKASFKDFLNKPPMKITYLREGEEKITFLQPKHWSGGGLVGMAIEPYDEIRNKQNNKFEIIDPQLNKEVIQSEEGSFMAPYREKYSGKMLYLGEYLKTQRFMPARSEFKKYFHPEQWTSTLPLTQGRKEMDVRSFHGADMGDLMPEDIFGSQEEGEPITALVGSLEEEEKAEKEKIEKMIGRLKQEYALKNIANEGLMDTPMIHNLFPFAVIQRVFPNSPAAAANLVVGDLLVKTDTIDRNSTHDPLAALKSLFPKFENREMKIILERYGKEMTTYLKPKRWAGQGLVGCAIVDYDPNQIQQFLKHSTVQL